MKRILLLLVMALVAFGACKKENDELQKLTLSDGVIIVNQGNFTAGNATLSYYETGSNKKYSNIFSSVNNIPLGDVAQSITIDDETAFVVVNNSGVIQAIDRWTAEVKGKITELGSPRHMLKISETKAYVSDFFKNSITIINPSTFEKTGEINVDRSTEEMVQFGSEVFVAHWTEYNQTLKNNKVLIISELTDNLSDSITVGVEPNSMVLDGNNHLWVLCSGGYTNTEIPSLWKVDAATHQVIDTLMFPEIQSNPVSLEINGTGDTLYYLNNGVFKMSVNATQLPDSAFIKEDTERYFLTLGVDPVTNDIYTTNAYDYLQNGRVYRFDYLGNYITEFEVEIVPGAFGFNYR